VKMDRLLNVVGWIVGALLSFLLMLAGALILIVIVPVWIFQGILAFALIFFGVSFMQALIRAASKPALDDNFKSRQS
jgi:heme A synthase